jgi:CheY-like chemotaxis protein
MLPAVPAGADAERAPGSAEPAPTPLPASTLRVLVAEDNDVNQAVARGLLLKRGHLVTLASNGRDAVTEATATALDVILMDVQMPDMDGLEATRLIRSTERATGRHVRIVALTAHAREEDRKRCLEAGMDDYLSKPFSAQDLFRAVEAARGPVALRRAV